MVDVFKSRLDVIMKDPDNMFCADCSDRAPRWSSVKLGILVCANCAGIHRKLGTHISFVQSLTIDKWKLEWVELCEKIGNRVSNEYYEASIPGHLKKPTPITEVGTSGDTIDTVTAARLEKWLRNKYELKLFVNSASIDPVELVKQGKNPKHDDQQGPQSRRKDKKKKSSRKDLDNDFSPPRERLTNQIILPSGWQSNIFLKSWAISNGIADSPLV